MKKVKVWLATFVALVVCVCCLAACGGSVEGKYKFYSITIGEKTYKAGDEIDLGITSMKIGKDFMELELKSDGTCSMKSSMSSTVAGEEAEAEVGTWKKDENDANKIIVTVAGENTEFKKDGNKLVVEETIPMLGTMKVVLKK